MVELQLVRYQIINHFRLRKEWGEQAIHKISSNGIINKHHHTIRVSICCCFIRLVTKTSNLIILGHSQGGCAVINATIENPKLTQCLILDRPGKETSYNRKFILIETSICLESYAPITESYTAFFAYI